MKITTIHIRVREPAQRRTAQAQQEHGDREHLRDHLGLPEFARVNRVAFGRGDATQAGDGELTADDDHHHPGRNTANLHQRNQRGGNQKLVGDRIEQGADRGDLLPSPGEKAIQQIRAGRHEKDRKRQKLVRRIVIPFQERRRLPVDEYRHKQRHEEDAEEG